MLLIGTSFKGIGATPSGDTGAAPAAAETPEEACDRAS
jgi:hypothetical protein